MGDVFYIFKKFKNQVENECSRHIKVLRSHRGGEYFSHELSNHMKNCGFRHQFRCRYTPQQNGVAERKNRHCTLLTNVKLQEILEEVWCGRKPNLSHLKIFGCVCYVHVLDELRTKLDSKYEKCICLGYAIQQKGYSRLLPSSGTHIMFLTQLSPSNTRRELPRSNAISG